MEKEKKQAALRGKQLIFINEYLQCWNAAEAARRAGYSERTARQIAYKLMHRADVQAEIKKRLAESTMQADEALMRLTEHGRGDMGKFLRLTFEELQNFEQARLIKKVKRTTRRDKDGVEIEYFEIELYDAQAAMNTILREAHLRGGEPTERVEVNDGALSDEDRAAKIAALLEKVKSRAAADSE